MRRNAVVALGKHPRPCGPSLGGAVDAYEGFYSEF